MCDADLLRLIGKLKRFVAKEFLSDMELLENVDSEVYMLSRKLREPTEANIKEALRLKCLMILRERKRTEQCDFLEAVPNDYRRLEYDKDERGRTFARKADPLSIKQLEETACAS